MPERTGSRMRAPLISAISLRSTNCALAATRSTDHVRPCGGVDRFAVHLGKQLFNCRGCGIRGRGAIDLVMAIDGVDFLGAIESITGQSPPSGRAPAQPDPDRERKRKEERARREKLTKQREEQRQDEAHRHELARMLWARCERATEESPPALYLRKRGYTGIIPATIGYLPQNGKHPAAMITAFGIPDELEPGLLARPGTVNQVHLTRLTAAGDKANIDPVKIIIGPGTGAPIVLAPPNDLLGLAVTEGIEDGLSVYAATGLGVWAAGSAGRMPALAAVVPSFIEVVTVFAHPDDAGRRGARQLARALIDRGIETLIEGLRP
jgi:putative DNA primase/helicase